ncbi:hypothetical protein ABZ639_26835 [Saccharomonospora sp. NPDC006951]
MSFDVSPEALDRCAAMLDRYSEHSVAVKDFYLSGAQMGLHAQGLVGALIGTHDTLRSSMSERTGLMESIGTNSADSMRAAAHWYRSTDTTVAADLDETYPGADCNRSAVDEAAVTPGLELFGDIVDPGEALTLTSTADDLEPKMGEVEQWARTTGDYLSPASWIRTFVKDLLGTDPIEWLLQWFGGDWRAWAECALTWQACGQSVQRISMNVDRADGGLARVWTGNAADAAIDYVQRLEAATITESAAFGNLYEVYRGYAEYVYHSMQILNDMVNALIDTVTTAAALAGVTAVTGATVALLAPFVWGIWEIVNKIMTTVTVVIDAVRMFEAYKAVSDLPAIPATALTMLSPRGTAPGYRHPETGE